VLRTPLRRSAWLSELVSAEVLLKLELLQPTFSYKIRGALNVVERLVEGGPSAPALVTASAGNHGRALAYAAARRALGLTVYAPENAPRTKLDAIRALGAHLQLCRDYDEAERAAKSRASESGEPYISPYSHPDVIAGAGTVGLEILQERPDVSSIVVPVGGGGLVGGIAIAAQGVSLQTAVVAVEAESSHPFTSSRAAGRIVTVDVKTTLADGLAGNLDPDTVTFEIVERLVPEIVTVSENAIREAMRGIVERERLVVEGAGAVGVAGLLAQKIKPAGRCVAIVLSGANVDSTVLKSVL
jgi:threonine dehydratase